jgi:acylphosphatase
MPLTNSLPELLSYNVGMSSQSVSRLEAVVSGMVQGVYFRHFTRQEANRLNLTGWVANQPDGTVKVVAEGDKSNLDNLLDFLHNGPPAARVENVKTTWSDAEGAYTEFRVRY